MRSLTHAWWLLLIILAGSCEEPFEYHPNEIRLKADEQNLTQKYLDQLSKQPAGDTIRFILMGDTQRFYDHILDFVESARLQQHVDFMLHAGDISDFGMAQEFRWVHSLLRELPFPYLTVVGNHDLLANGTKIYQQMYGPLNYFFDYGSTRFLMLDTNSREYNFDGSTPDLIWLEQNLTAQGNFTQSVVIGHIPPSDSDFDQKLQEKFVNIQKANGVLLNLYGHQHKSNITHPYGDDLPMIITNSMKGRSYFVIEIWKGGYDAQEVIF
ncbi:MAG: metallophosphoesterase [Bacteroidetes bacterium]|nr:metallophosphoesterase [Bacteroidota bacterium]